MQTLVQVSDFVSKSKSGAAAGAAREAVGAAN